MSCCLSKLYVKKCANINKYFLIIRNAAADTVDQELLYVGSESGKMVAFRNIVQKVRLIKYLITMFHYI